MIEKLIKYGILWQISQYIGAQIGPILPYQMAYERIPGNCGGNDKTKDRDVECWGRVIFLNEFDVDCGWK